jgi:exosome complex component CSL4
LDSKVDFTTTKKLLKPGDYMCGAEEKAPGQGTSEMNGEICATVFGEEVEGGRDAEVHSAKSVCPVRIGDEVLGVITNVMDSKALADVFVIQKSKSERFGKAETAALKVADISDRYVKFVSDEFRIGDIIKARVVDTQNGTDLSTKGNPAYGVIKAFCTRCRHAMVLKGSKVICKSCGRSETRKLSKDYVEQGEA